MNYQELAIFGAFIFGLLVLAVCVLDAPWKISTISERLTDGILIFLIVIVCSALAYTTILLHDPARATFNHQCDHPKPHKRPAGCK